jgi:biopolymer transport protein TolR
MGVNLNTSKGAFVDINVVPLIDILLVLIIIFMVISPIVPKGLHTLVPQEQPNDGLDTMGPVPKPIVIEVGPGGALAINQARTSWETLGSDMDSIFKFRAEKVAFVQGDDSADFADVARAIDIMRSHGIDKVGLLTAKLTPA